MPKARRTNRRDGADRLGRDRVAEAALKLAADRDWYGVSMRDLARALGVGLADLAGRYRDPDAVADAVFARARDAMLALKPPGFARLKPRRRVELAVRAWFESLGPHRRAAAGMLKAKLHPGHAHHWGPLSFHLSRLIWWLREAALLDAEGPRRQAEEIALSAIFLAVLAAWALGGGGAEKRAFDLLARLLDGVERPLGWNAR
jgi:AcrR family transcriptional regulator